MGEERRHVVFGVLRHDVPDCGDVLQIDRLEADDLLAPLEVLFVEPISCINVCDAARWIPLVMPRPASCSCVA
jgi:hypothetical protein